MIIYPRERDTQLPICKHCLGTIRQTGLRDKEGNYWHANCHGQHLDNLLAYVKENLETIIEQTKPNNSAASIIALDILKRLEK